MNDMQWADPNLQGIVGHCHVPNNDHSDPGTLDYDRLGENMDSGELAHTLGGTLNLIGQVSVPLVGDDLRSTDLYTIGQALSFIHQELKMARLADPAVAVFDDLLMARIRLVVRDATMSADDIKDAVKTALREGTGPV
jgi:hypothetical protein